MTSEVALSTALLEDRADEIRRVWFSEPRVGENKSFIAIRDRYPVNDGHTLIVSKRSAVSVLELTREEFQDLYDMIRMVTEQLTKDFDPAGFNIGANCGEAAGQTVKHCHVHVIPRYEGDVDNPRGGVRNVKPPLVPY